MSIKPMNALQVGAFWAWYNSFNGDNKRSVKRAAEAVGLPEEQVKRWHQRLEWDRLAEEKDRELYTKLEGRVMGQIIRDFNAAKERHCAITAALYRRFLDIIPTLEPEQLKVADLIKLMEFERVMLGDQPGAQDGKLLPVVLALMAPEDRVKFNAAVERARDSGRIRFADVGSPQRN